MRVSPSEISFVVQGPVVHAANGGTQQVCASIRRFFPDAEIILSTWEGTDVSEQDADQIVLSPDPGPLIPGRNLNLNRQIVSSREGVRRATRPFVMKTRSDILFTSDSVLAYWDRWNDFAPDLRLFQKRVLIPNTFTFKPNYFSGSAFHPSDWCFLGLREDVEFLFDIPLCPLERLLVESPLDPVVAWKWSEPYAERHTNEQYLWLMALQKRFPHLTTQMFTYLTPEDLPQTELAFANNFVALDAARQFGIFAPKYPDAETAFGAGNLLTHQDWKSLYDAYCAVAPPPLPACALDDLRAANGDFRDWTDNDPRFTSLRRAGCAWEAMLLACALRMPADTRGWNVKKLLDTEQTVDALLALVLWAKAHLMARLALSPTEPHYSRCAPPPSDWAGSASSENAASKTLETIAEREGQAGIQANASLKPGHVDAPANTDYVNAIAEPTDIFAPDLDVWQKRGATRRATICLMARPDEPLTKTCLESMAQQTCPDTDFLLFLNGPRNADPAWLSDFLSNHPEFLLARSPRTLPAAQVWNYCFAACVGVYVVMAGARDLLNRTCVKELVTAMQAYPHTAVGRAALVQGAASGMGQFFPLTREDTLLSAGDAVIACLHHGAFTRSPSVTIFRRELACRLPALCDARFERFALEEFILRLIIPGGLVCRAGRGGIRPPSTAAFPRSDAASKRESVARYQEECRLKVHALREYTRSKTLRYNQTFVAMLALRLNVFGLVDALSEEHVTAEPRALADEQAAMEKIYRNAAADLREMGRDVSARTREEAVASYQSGDMTQALAQLESLVADAPYYGPGHNDLSVLLCDRGDFARSLVHSKQAVAIMPDDPDALRNLACILALSDRKADAVQAYQRLLDIVPNDAVACQALNALCS